jgi:multidrug efflux pump subunit AcrB
MVVVIPYPGASPETVEREIINRVEKSLQSIPQVYQIRSTAARARRRSSSSSTSRRTWRAADEIRNAIASVRHKLPIEMREPILRRIDPVGAADHAARALLDGAEHRGDLAPRRGPCSPTASARSTAWRR